MRIETTASLDRSLPKRIDATAVDRDVCRLHAAAGRGDQAEVQALQKGLDTRSVSLDMATRAILDLIVKACCLKGGVMLSEPDYRRTGGSSMWRSR